MQKSGTQKWWALGAINLSVLAVALDGTILSLVLPTLAKALKASESNLEWFSAGYLLVLAAMILPAGFSGDRFGRKKLLLASLSFFGVGSILCAYAHSPVAFLWARILMGVAGAGITVMALTTITTLFSPKERPKAIGIFSAANFIGLPLGPILGGWMLGHFWWGWVFLMNVPVVLIAILVVTALVSESRATHKPKLDAFGVLSSSAGLVALIYGLITAGERGWGNAKALASMAVGACVLAGFWIWEKRLTKQPGKQPLVDLTLFRSRSYTWGAILASIMGLAMIGVLFTLPQYYQGVLGASTMKAGVGLVPLVLGLALSAGTADKWCKLIGTKFTIMLGFIFVAASSALGAQTSLTSSSSFAILWSALLGIGVGLALASANSAALSELSKERTGSGSAFLQLLQKTSGPFGATILGSTLAAAYQSRLLLPGLSHQLVATVHQSVFAGVAVADALGSASLKHTVRGAFVHGMDTALLISSGIALVGAVLALLFVPRKLAVKPKSI